MSTNDEAKIEVARACGIIMPISDHPDYDTGHWNHVFGYVSRAIEGANLHPSPVWELPESEIIHERVVTNIFEMPFAVCDVSSRNPNVMLELGMRLSFGKPVIVITDDLSSMPFDISLISALPYPKSLSMPLMEPFIDALTKRLESVVQSVDDETYKPFIKNFGPIEPGALGGEQRDAYSLILKRLDGLEFQQRRPIQPEQYTEADFWPPLNTIFGEPGRERMIAHLRTTGMKEVRFAVDRTLHLHELKDIRLIRGVTAVFQDRQTSAVSILTDGSFDETTFSSVISTVLGHLTKLGVNPLAIGVGVKWPSPAY